MSLNFKVINNIAAKLVAAKIKEDKQFWTYAAKRWKKLIDPYTPYDTGALMKTYYIRPNEIHYTVPYATRIYYGSEFNFKKDKHILATYMWDRHARLTQEPILLYDLQTKLNAQMKGEKI